MIEIPKNIQDIIEEQIEAYPMTQEDRELNRTKLKLFAEMGYCLGLSNSNTIPFVPKRLKALGFYVYINKHGLVFKKVNKNYKEGE